jgi:hypothetical protein
MLNQTEKMRNALTQGVRKGLSSYIWLLKILVPISLATVHLIAIWFKSRRMFERKMATRD